MQVKEWKPAEGCACCKRAAELFHEHTLIAGHTNTLAVDRIRGLVSENETLRQRVVELEKEQIAWRKFTTEANNTLDAAEAKLARIGGVRQYDFRTELVDVSVKYISAEELRAELDK